MSDNVNETIRQGDPEFLLSEYLDGQLPRREAVAMEERLERDPELCEQLRRYAVLDGKLAALAGEPDDVDYDAQRVEMISTLERRELLSERRRPLLLLRGPWMRVAAAAAVLAIVATVAVWMWTGRAEPRVQVSLSPPVEPTGGGGMNVSYPRVRVGELRLALPEEQGPGGMPAGTVVVSVGERAGRGAPDDMSAFPVWIE